MIACSQVLILTTLGIVFEMSFSPQTKMIYKIYTKKKNNEKFDLKAQACSQVSTTTLAWLKNACNLFWQGRILWLRPAVEWTVLLLSKTSKERRKIGGQAGGGKKGLGGKGNLEAVKYRAGMDGLTVWS